MRQHKHGRLDIIKTANASARSEFLDLHVNTDDLGVFDGAGKTSAQTYVLDIKLLFPVADTTGDDVIYMTRTTMDSCLELVEETSGEDYRASAQGWNKARKRREMSDKDMRYLVVFGQGEASEASGCSTKSQMEDRSEVSIDESKAARGAEEKPSGDSIGVWSSASGNSTNADACVKGFLSFMLTHEDGYPVIYIYEIHLKAELRGTGLGRHLMHATERIGTSVGVDKCMLTVFRSNDKARTWYERLGYGVDEYSPADKRLRNGTVKKADYVILSRKLPKARA